MNWDLSEFLLARIAEDEATARAAMGVPWEEIRWPNGSQILVSAAAIRDDHLRLGKLGHVASVEHSWDAEHIARWDPARVLAECEAKRQIVAMMDDPHRDTYEIHAVLAVLATPYADHPDYRSEWAS